MKKNGCIPRCNCPDTLKQQRSLPTCRISETMSKRRLIFIGQLYTMDKNELKQISATSKTRRPFFVDSSGVADFALRQVLTSPHIPVVFVH